MTVWFVRSNGATGHNNPNLDRYVEGGPPEYPETDYNYRELCLSRGFARIGWPATGNLRDAEWEQAGAGQYSDHEFTKGHRSYLRRFSGIRTGELVAIPADSGQYDVHLGRVVIRDRDTLQVKTLQRGLPAYYFHFDIRNGDWFENAHRVDVLWADDHDGQPSIYSVPTLGGSWFRAFANIHEAKATIEGIAEGAGLLKEP